MKIGIKAQLISFTSLLLFLVILILSFFVLNGVKTYQDKDIQNVLFKQKDMFEQYFSEKSNESESGRTELLRGNIFNKPWLRTIPANLYDPEGNMLSGFNNDSSIDENEERKSMISYAQNGQVCYKKVGKEVYFYSPIKYRDNTIAILELRYLIEDKIIFYNNIRNMFWGTGCISLIIGVVVGIIYFSKFTKDIYIMRNNVDEIQKGSFEKIESIKREDELGELNYGIECMSNTIQKNINDLQIERDSLSAAVDKLRKMDKKQKEFIGNVTHEFKTPITAIKAYGDLIGMYSEDLKLIEEGTTTISKECDRLESLVESVLELSALEKYEFEIERKEVNLKGIISDICEGMKGRIERNNLKLTRDLNDAVVIVDEEAIRHIVINLMDNAVKYSKDNGNISVRCYVRDNVSNIEVIDDGLGIKEDSLEKIFEPFYRVDKNRSRKAGGAGLGLALVKELVIKQGGTIKAESKLGEGSKFIVRIPC